MDGRLCAPAFVQAGSAYTGCTDAPNPDGVSGRPWCYVEAQDGGFHDTHEMTQPLDVEIAVVQRPDRLGILRSLFP